MPKHLTADQAISAARELRGDFGHHADLLGWRAQRLREPWKEPQIKALNIHPNVKDIVPYQSNVAAEEAHRYANAFTTADPELAVFVRSEKKTEQDIGARLEQVYDAAMAALWPDPYQAALYVAGEGFCPLRLDLKPEFWKGIPDRKTYENTESFNEGVDDHRKAIALPFELVTLDPSTFFYDEDKNREITVGVEFGKRKQTAITEAYKGKAREEFLGPTVPENTRAGTRMVDFVVVRTPDVLYHLQLGGDGGASKEASDKVLWEGPNLFGPDTGYILWRGLFSGDPNLGRRYHPFVLNTLTALQHLNLFLSLQANLAVQEQSFWEERAGQPHDNLPQRGITAEAKGAKGTKKSSRASATMEEGVVVRWREQHNKISELIARFESEIDHYKFPEALAPESSQGSSGRDTIRRQEASARLLRQGFVGRELAIKEILRTVIRTIFTHKPFLAGGRMIFVPLLEEGLGDEGTERKQEMLFIEESDNIPHELRVQVATSSQAADAALREEGARMEGRLSRDTIDEDFYGVKDIGLENRRRGKDAIRAAMYQVAVQRGLEEANARLIGRTPPGSSIVVPPEGSQATNGTTPAVDPAAAGRATPSQPEDLGIAGGGGPAPAPEA